MTCPQCGAPVVAFVVPAPLREYAPAPETAICTRCLGTVPAGETEFAQQEISAAGETDFTAVDPVFPSGDAGAALALLCGILESFALNRSAIEALVTFAEANGADVLLFLDRLDADDAAFDLERRRAAIRDIL